MNNPLQVIQFIPIYTCLTQLSDFLLIEEYIKEDEQHKPIPIVNAFYQYMENYHDLELKKFKLIRALLQGSGLYGEAEDETFDEIFANAMFDYIVSSLVFEKYGNIYGFIATVIFNVTDLQVKSVYSEIKNTLETATFENEYGNYSILTPLARNRVFTQLILPIFPLSKTDLSLSSIDYIYAQAGAHFLRSGRLDSVYYDIPDQEYENYVIKNTAFDEFVLAGYTIERLIFTNSTSDLSLNAFALPAFCNYIFANKNLFNNTDVKNVVHDVSHWEAAYEHLFLYIHETFDELEKKLKTDDAYLLHTAFSTFKRRDTIGRFFINIMCRRFNKEERERRLLQYLEYPQNYRCVADNSHQLPNLLNWYMENVNEVGQKYFHFELKLIKEAFGSTLITSLENDAVVITLLEPDDGVRDGRLSNSTHLPYDLLKFYFPKNGTIEQYALVQENYNAILIKEADNPELFLQKIGSYFSELEKIRSLLVLKSSDNKMDEFWFNFPKYKQNRLEMYLKSLSDDQLQSEWWKEFGLSLVPFYPCLSAQDSVKYFDLNNLCSVDEYTFLNLVGQDEEILFKLTQESTERFLNLKGLSPKTTFLTKSYRVDTNFRSREDVFRELSLHLDDFGFELTFLSNENLNTLQSDVDSLKRIIHHKNLEYVTLSLNNMKGLKIAFKKRVSSMGLIKETPLYVNSQNVEGRSGYGYKFVYLTSNKTADLRTDCKSGYKRLVSLVSTSPQNKYIKINPMSLQEEDDEVYFENDNHQLQRIDTKVFFAGMSIPRDSRTECDVDEEITKLTPSNKCPRAELWRKRYNCEEEAVILAQKNLHFSETAARYLLGVYIFPDDSEMELQFMNDWANSPDSTKPMWVKKYLISNRYLLFELRYDMLLENSTLSIEDIELRISSAYTLKERARIEKETPLLSIITAYKYNKEYYSATFEDYYALYNFAKTGYTRITGDTNEARRMKIALYKLAIRQSDDLSSKTINQNNRKTSSYLKLYTVECKPQQFIDNYLVPGGKIQFRKFTPTYTNQSFVIKLAARRELRSQTVLYEMSFSNFPISAKLQFSTLNEKQVIILPGIEFNVKNTEISNEEGFGEVLKVQLTHNHSMDEKNDWYIRIMNKLRKLRA